MTRSSGQFCASCVTWSYTRDLRNTSRYYFFRLYIVLEKCGAGLGGGGMEHRENNLVRTIMYKLIDLKMPNNCYSFINKIYLSYSYNNII